MEELKLLRQLNESDKDRVKSAERKLKLMGVLDKKGVVVPEWRFLLDEL